MSRGELLVGVLYLAGSACFFAGTLISLLTRGAK